MRRRVQADPASIAFAQLAEECRRAESFDEAVGIARAGLQYHPDYLSARVTLGRALIELERLDEAESELRLVLKSAPDNLAANRALAEVFQRRGQLPEALAQYRKALDLAKFDPDLAQQVTRIESVVEPPPPPVESVVPQPRVEDLFDFDTLPEQLGGRTQPQLKFDAGTHMPAAPAAPAPSAIESVTLREDDADPFSVLERQLRESESEPMPAGPNADERAEQQMLAELEEWLGAISIHRDQRPNA
ncbi:MAG TPA: tetratricopeptide repeat protein [Vicinamibacterales bacterium]|nr:tetratricopeptide repeat protein [Vicinamibacterales bacterium]